MFDEPYFVFYYLLIFLCFYRHWESYLIIRAFSWIFQLLFKFFHQLFDCKMVVIVWQIAVNHRNFICSLVSWIADTVCSRLVFTCIMTVITDSSIISADTMKLHSIEFLIIIIINIKSYGIVMELCGIKVFIIAIIIIKIIVIIINIIRSCSINMTRSDIKFLTITITIVLIIAMTSETFF